MNLIQARRANSKMRLALHGPSGSGKTYSAIQLAKGLSNNGKIAVIDTEAGSSVLYSDLGEFYVLKLSEPYTPEKFIQAIKTCEEAMCDVIIIDSLSHAWEGNGGVLEIHGQMPGNSFANWSKVMPRHNSLLQAILRSNAHTIVTLRAKQDYLIDQSTGRMNIQKIGLKPVQKDGIDYEFTLALDIDIHHKAKASKDRTGLFMDQDPFLITPKTGNAISQWCNQESKIKTHEYFNSTPSESSVKF